MCMDSYILSFESINPKDADIVGGKAYHLGFLLQRGFPVPVGFCVTAHGYLDFLAYNNLKGAVSAAAAVSDAAQIPAVSAALREKILRGDLPIDLEQALLKGLQQLNPAAGYAVRSSALEEDGAFASFAGQQDTYLNVRGQDALLEHVKGCWASLFGERAMLYRLQSGITEELPAIAVVVQEMVPAAAAGIMFTADPGNGHRGRLCIEAGFGLGEALVSGLVRSDLYVLEKESGAILRKEIGKKELQIVSGEAGGVETKAIYGDLAEQQVLTDELIAQLACWGKQAEALYGAPQDMEWCLEGDKLFVLQCRPITSLFPLPEPPPEDQRLHVYLSFSHLQVMTEPISPLGIDLLRFFPSVDSAKHPQDYPFVKAAAGRVYVDLSSLLAHNVMGKGIAKLSSNIDYLFHSGLTQLRARSDFQPRIAKNPAAVHALRGFAFGIVRKAAWNILFRKPEGNIAAYTEHINDVLGRAQETLRRAESPREKLLAIRSVLDFRNEFRHAMPKVGAGILSYKMAVGLEAKTFGDHRYVDGIISGFEGSFTGEMGLKTADLAEHVRQSPALVALLSQTPSRELSAKIEGLDSYPDFRACFADFMEHFGMRGSGEIDVGRSRFCEDPAPLVQTILAMAQSTWEKTPREEYREKSKQSLEQEQELLRLMREEKGYLKSRVMARLLRVMRNYLPLRETPKHLICCLLMLVKEELLSLGKELVRQERLTAAEDIFFLRYWELLDGTETGCDYRPLVAAQKLLYRHYAKLTPPRILTSDGEEIRGSYQHEALPEHTFAGMPTSAGRVEGIARVILDPGRESLAKGEILIAPFTDPGWTPLFLNAAALVAEVGGLLTHGSIVAREYGIPAVVGVENATKVIKTGQRIVVDGNQGWVQILDRE